MSNSSWVLACVLSFRKSKFWSVPMITSMFLPCMGAIIFSKYLIDSFFICVWYAVNFTYNCRFTINRGFNENRLKFPFFKNFKIMTSDKGKLFRIDMATPPLRLLWLLWIKVYPGIWYNAEFSLFRNISEQYKSNAIFFWLSLSISNFSCSNLAGRLGIFKYRDLAINVSCMCSVIFRYVIKLTIQWIKVLYLKLRGYPWGVITWWRDISVSWKWGNAVHSGSSIMDSGLESENIMGWEK